MDIAGGISYDHVKEDCPRVLSMALRKRYKHIPELGCMISDKELMTKVKSGLKKHNLALNQIYESHTNFIDIPKVSELLKHLFENKKDGFFVLEHNNPKETRHLFAFLYNDQHKTLDFFDSYNESRTFYTLRLKKNQFKKFINDVFHKYFEDEFVIEKMFEFN